MEIDHIGIAAEDGEKLALLYEKHFGAQKSKKTENEDLGFTSQFIHFEKGKIEILQPMRMNSIIGRFLEKRGEGIHHISFRVNNLEKIVEFMGRDQYDFIDTIQSYDGDGEKLKYIFLHPKCTNGILVELHEVIK
ncbi:VOC family protein [Thermotalea metallivorans]|uniref:VOC domain-containing protein n=1 Tax=Thermotalea metallivorans TaxID=520762 RepID=A0A140L7A4_9FIRM|nr:VOC family protein [Thermotalea metallivorans]KXG76429.1 hypothetical protein AN619_09600 [Thermotalea metallivorans]